MQMKTVTKGLRRFLRAKRGANLVEYLLLVGVVALVALGGYNAFGKSLKGKVGDQTKTVEGINTVEGG